MAKKVPEINAGSMADISFLMLIFFLVTTTMDVDSGIVRRLPPLPEKDAEIPEVKERNIFNVLVNKNDRLFIDNRWGDIRTLRAETKEFLANPADREDLPEKKVETLPYLGDFPVSRGIISLKNDRGTSYNMYIQVQNELTAAVNELRDELARQRFGKPLSEITDQEIVSAIQKAIPMSISEAEPEDIGGTK